jgi:hypothetical protein
MLMHEATSGSRGGKNLMTLFMEVSPICLLLRNSPVMCSVLLQYIVYHTVQCVERPSALLLNTIKLQSLQK